MPDRTIIFAQNGRHGLRGISALNPAEFEAYHEDDDALTYTFDLASYLGSDTISSVTRTPSGPTVSNEANTTTQLTQRLKGAGHVDFKVTTAGGDIEEFRLFIRQRVSTSAEINQAAEVPDPMAQTYTSTSDPTRDDDTGDGHWVGRFWLNTATGNLFFNKVNAAGAAVWGHMPRTLAQGTTSALTGTTAETALYALTIAANTLATGAQVDIHHGWENNNSANTKTRRIRFGSANDLNGTIVTGIGPTTDQSHYNKHVIYVSGGSSQVASVDGIGTAGSYGGFSGTFLTATVDITQVSYLVFSGQLANSGDNMTLKHYSVTLSRPDIT